MGKPAKSLDLCLYLLGNGAGKWIAEIEHYGTLYHDTFRFTDYNDEKQAEGFAAVAAEYRWRQFVGDPLTQVTVNRVYVEPAKAEEA